MLHVETKDISILENYPPRQSIGGLSELLPSNEVSEMLPSPNSTQDKRATMKAPVGRW